MKRPVSTSARRTPPGGARRRGAAGQPRYFATAADFRSWLEREHGSASELSVGFRTRASGEPSLTWPEAVDQALCFGWIDGVRRRIDATRFSIRFTPRRPTSTWSAINIARVAALEAAGSMRPAGRAAFERRTERRSPTYSYEQSQGAELEPALLRTFRASAKAWEFFQEQAPSYRRKCAHWVSGAKSADVRAQRLSRLIASCAKARRL